MGPDRYFILIYDVPSREVEIHEFERDYVAATAAYTAFELEHRDDRGTEVVLVGADSIETIHKTHSHYFAEHIDELFKQFLDVGAEGEARVIARTRRRARRRRGHAR